VNVMGINGNVIATQTLSILVTAGTGTGGTGGTGG